MDLQLRGKIEIQGLAITLIPKIGDNRAHRTLKEVHLHFKQLEYEPRIRNTLQVV